ncbi:MAG: DUF6116 family protein [Megasphaera elsdenii]|nr:DUF6116 family protein [Megasphaera elsdenii]
MLKLLLWGILYFVLIGICFTSGLLARVTVFLLNCILPDPIPYADEVLMGMGVLTKVIELMEHPVRFILKYVLLAIAIIVFVYYIGLRLGEILF